MAVAVDPVLRCVGGLGFGISPAPQLPGNDCLYAQGAVPHRHGSGDACSTAHRIPAPQTHACRCLNTARQRAQGAAAQRHRRGGACSTAHRTPPPHTHTHAAASTRPPTCSRGCRSTPPTWRSSFERRSVKTPATHGAASATHRKVRGLAAGQRRARVCVGCRSLPARGWRSLVSVAG